MAEARSPQVVTIKMPDGTIRKWDMANEPKPDSVGNQSRNGFLYNCYTHPMGRFLQETVKWGLEKIILRIHDRDIPRYDKNAYVFDDPRLDHIIRALKGTMVKHIDDNDTVRKHKLFGAFIEMSGFFMKEDAFYRSRGIMGLRDLAEDYLAHPEMYELTPEEQYNYYKFNGMGSTSCHSQILKTFPSPAEIKADPSCIARWKAVHNPTGKQVV